MIQNFETEQGIFYTRYEHGSKLVQIMPDKFVLGDPSKGETQEFKNTKALMRAIYQKRTPVSFDKYFSQGQYAKVRILVPPPLFSFFTVKKTKKMGIDLENRGHEVAKLFYSGFASDLMKSGYDVEEVLQEIYRGLITRNNGTCPYDETKSSFGHYIHMVSSCIIANYIKKENRKRSKESIGICRYTKEGWENQDASEHTNLISEKVTVYEQDLELSKLVQSLTKHIMESKTPHKEMVVKIMVHLVKGHTQSEIIEILGCSKSMLRRCISLLRKRGREWYQEI